jgi:hypothetical protein
MSVVENDRVAATLLAAGVFDAPAALGASVALVVPWFGLGFALYAVAFAAAGALASRQQDASAAGQPVTLTLIAALVRIAGRVYAHGLLHSGPRLDARTVWRLIRQT